MLTLTTLTKPCLLWLAAALAALALAACAGGAADAPSYSDAGGGAAATGGAGSPVAVTVPALSDTAQAGAAVFNSRCALCHGANAAGGTGLGPPLVHIIYEPGHHQDFAFRNAVQNGVPSHHWQFGDMLPVPGVAAEDVERIICYVRELQRANGIFEDAAGLAAC